jgi:hypothetical protein
VADPVGHIRVERLILHGLDNRHPAPRLVDEPVLLTDEIVGFFALHLHSAATRADWRGRFSEPSGEVPQLCAALLNGHEDFVGASRLLALRLFEQMRPRTIAPGDLAVIVFTEGEPERRHVALLKLDPDQRLARSFTSREGRTRVSIDVADNLLPDMTHLQKCALLRASEADGTFEVTILDTQAGPKADGVAAFFYHGFLTAELVPSPRRRTREFIRCCDLWLADHRDALTPAELSAFYAARRAALARNLVLSHEFAAEALANRPELRRALVERLGSTFATEGEPVEGFPVDPMVAAPVVQRVTLELDGGARLSVPADRFNDLVRIAPARTGENKYRIVIESQTLKEVSDR